MVVPKGGNCTYLLDGPTLGRWVQMVFTQAVTKWKPRNHRHLVRPVHYGFLKKCISHAQQQRGRGPVGQDVLSIHV